MRTRYRFLAFYLAGVLGLAACLPGETWAAFLASQELPVTETRSPERLQQLLESTGLRERLAALGLSDAEIRERLAQLPSEQRQHLIQQLQLLEAGRGDATLILVLLLVLAFVTYLYVTGKRVIIE